jgi:hypothetical protein
MTIKKLLAAACLGAIAIVCLTAEKLSAQAEGENRYSSPIEMVVNAGTNGERQRASHDGVMEAVGLWPNEQIAITLTGSSFRAKDPVGIAPLDGGEIFADPDLSVAGDGTVAFAFQGGRTPGLYRVVITVGPEQYQLQLYVARPQNTGPDCQEP